MIYKYRYLQNVLGVRPSAFRAVLITGPRRSGKSTFAKHLQHLWGGGDYITFDTPLEQARFRADPVGFVDSLKTPAVLDEVQNVPELFQYLKVAIDRSPNAPCDYILTGSQQFQMMHRVSQSLAGRLMIRELLPFSLGEACESDSSQVLANAERLLRLDTALLPVGAPIGKTRSLFELLAAGGYPQAALAASERDRNDWFHSYVETYVQRDVRALSNLPDLSLFSRFVMMMAGRTAHILNYSELGKDLGINYKTAQHYLSLLEASYLIKTLLPFAPSGSEKRLSKRPKGVFVDSGLAHFLTGQHVDGLERSPMLGTLFESFVIAEFAKLFAAVGARVTPLHFRAREDAEVDLIIEHGTTLIPIEIKCSSSVSPSWGRGIKAFREVAGLSKTHPGFVLSLYTELKQIAPDVWNLPLGILGGSTP